MKKEKKYGLTIDEKILILFFMFMGLYELSRAFYWLSDSNLVKYDSGLYFTLAEIFPLYVWAVPFLVSGILLIMAGFYSVKKDSKTFYITLMTGSFFATLGHAILTMASINNGISVLTPLQNFALTMLFLSILVVGGDSLWKRMKK